MYAILLYQDFLKANNKIDFVEEHKYNIDFNKLLYVHSFHYKEIQFPKLNLPLLQKHTINEFYKLALEYRTKKVQWGEFFKSCDRHSYEVYKQILKERLKIKLPNTSYYNIRKFIGTQQLLGYEVVEEHTYGKKVCIIKKDKDVIIYDRSEYIKDNQISQILNSAVKDDIVIYAFKAGDMYSIYDMECSKLSQIERMQKLSILFYQNEKEMKKRFSIPSHQRSNYNFESGKIYLIKSVGKSQILYKLKRS